MEKILRTTVVNYYAEREEIALQVVRSVRRGRDPFLDELYPMGLFRPAAPGEDSGNCLGSSCFRPVAVERFASWPSILDLLEGLESGHGSQQLHAKRLIATSGAALAAIADAQR